MTFTAPTLPQEVYGEANVRLGRLEVEHGVTIILAVESGSRAWGFPSPDSDNDVRFLYAHPVSHYLGLNPPADTINPKIDGLWDLGGWDIRKALKLMVGGNATCAEWLQSPLIYREHGSVPYRLRDLMKRHSSPQSSAKHYYGLTNTCYMRDIATRPPVAQVLPGDTGTEVNQKKYLYAVRGAASIAHIRRYDEVPPMTLPALMSTSIIPDDVRGEINSLLVRKATMGEFGNGPRIECLDLWIEQQISWVKAEGLDKTPVSKEFEAEANQLLLEALGIG